MNDPFYFELEDDESLIKVSCHLAGDNYNLALDTGASNTVIDLNILLVAGYKVEDAIRIIKIETAGGIIEAYVFLIAEIKALGITRRYLEVSSYDFANNNILSEIQGVLGLDFFKGYKFCIDMTDFEITVQRKVRGQNTEGVSNA